MNKHLQYSEWIVSHVDEPHDVRYICLAGAVAAFSKTESKRLLSAWKKAMLKRDTSRRCLEAISRVKRHFPEYADSAKELVGLLSMQHVEDDRHLMEIRAQIWVALERRAGPNCWFGWRGDNIGFWKKEDT